MPTSFDEWLAEADDSQLCHEMCSRLEAHHQPVNASSLSAVEQVVWLVWLSKGIIDNGGFRHLFESDVPGDPHLALSAAAYERIGCPKRAAAFRATLAYFPGSLPPANIDKRLRNYLRQVKVWPTPEDNAYLSGEAVEAHLAAFIREHREAFAHLAAPPARQEERSVEYAPLQTGPPHWIRVAVAAHCARLVLPLIEKLWPSLPPAKRRELQEAATLAMQSAREGQTKDGLRQARMQAVMMAGQALMGAGSEEGPLNALVGSQASSLAKVVEKAAEAAEAAAAESALPFREAVQYALSVADAAGPRALRQSLMKALRKAEHRAKQRGWPDQTPAPADLFDEPPPPRPWWKLW
jgi:hypothetical protein